MKNVKRHSYILLERKNNADLNAAVALIREIPGTRPVGFFNDRRVTGFVCETPRELTEVEHEVLGAVAF